MARLVDFVALYCPSDRFGPAYLDHIVSQVAAHYAGPHAWTFLTTEVSEPTTWRAGGREVAAIPLAEPWKLRARWQGQEKPTPYWCFSKLECFREDLGLGDRAVMTDLDNFVVGPLDDLLAYDGDIGMRPNFLPAQDQIARGAKWQSSWIMYRPSACHDIWETARALGGGELAQRFPPLGGGGDQAFLSWARPRADDLEQLYPGALASYRWRWCEANERARERMRVLYCHGQPKPHQIGWRPA